MEENKAEVENSTPNSKPSYEQLEKIALQLQQRLMQAEARLGAINLATMRLDYLFRILDRASHFPDKFVEDSVSEIIDLLEVKTPETKPQAIESHEE